MHIASDSKVEKEENSFKLKCCGWIVILLILLTVGFAILMVLVNNISKKEYVAAVVEYSPIIYNSPRKTILENVEQYETIINNASHYDVDIIVFPEAGLTGMHLLSDRDSVKEGSIEIPSPENANRPCSDPSCDKVLKKLSCAAKTNKIYVAVNLIEICYCSENDEHCPEDGSYLYNSNIVFDREGTLIARYRKYNLFTEKAVLNSTKEPELCTFTTDFDVTFGMFICFDIIFREPSVRLVQEKHVTDIVFSTAWFSELPLLTAVSVQAAWAYSMDVNLLASGYNCPEMMSGGSGIYAGTKGPLVVIMPQQSGTKVLISKVPKKNIDSTFLQYFLELEEELFEKNTKRNSFILSNDKNVGVFNDMKFLQDLSLRSFEIQPLQFTENELVINRLTYENDNFSCHIEVTWKNEKKNNYDYSNYKMIAYSGNRNFSTASVNYIEACGLILCAESKINTCGIIPDFHSRKSYLKVLSVKISAKSYNVSSIPVPSTLDSSLYPLDVSDFTFSSSIIKENDKEFYSIEMNLIKPISNLITFAVYKLPTQASNKHKTR